MTTCPQCGRNCPSNVAGGMCPECLLKAGMAGETSMPNIAQSFTPPTPDELATFFPGLEIMALLGRGGMGAVYKVRQKQLDRVAALKILPPDVGRDPSFAERFEREAKALAKLNHPNIVTIYEFGKADGLYFFLMEFVDGVNLRQLLNAGKLEAKEALAIVPQICEALQFAHDHGIVHRDIKPENLLLDKNGRVKIADFGIAKMLGGTQAAGGNGSESAKPEEVTAGVVGTPRYSAPEQKSSPQSVDSRADIYSLGVVFYEMLTGELPGKPIEAPSRKVQIDVRLDEVVLRALQKMPEMRFATAAEFRTQVETIASTPMASDARSRAPADKPTERPSGWADLTARVLGFSSFKSPLASKLANASALGFLGFLSNLGYLPLPGMSHCLGFAGFFGFFGLLGVAAFVERLTRRTDRNTQNAMRESNPLPAMDFWEAMEAGDYARAWEKSAAYFQHDIDKDAWVNRMEKIRRPLGKAVSCRTLSQTFITPMRRFEQRVLTCFDSKQSATQVSICALQPDGEWRVEKYDIQDIHPATAPSGATTDMASEADKAAWEKRAPGWRIRCRTCGLIEHWGKYGIRWRATGTNWTLGRCAHCDCWRIHVIEKGPVPPVQHLQPTEGKQVNRAPYVVFGLLYLAFVACVFGSASALPERVATHFGLEGRANDWMSRPNYLLFISAIPAVLAIIFAGVLRLVRRASAKYINIPRRDYWLAPERRERTAALIGGYLTWLLCLLTLFFGGLHALTIDANRTDPARLSMDALMALIIVFLISTMIWLSVFLMRMANVDTDRNVPGKPTGKNRAGRLALIAVSVVATIVLVAVTGSYVERNVVNPWQSERLLETLNDKTQNLDEQLSIIGQSIALDGSNRNARVTLAIKLLQKKDYKQAADAWRYLGFIDKTHMGQTAVCPEGIAHLFAGELTQAAACLEDAVHRSPDFVTARVFLAAAYADLGLREKVATELVLLAKLKPKWLAEFQKQPDLLDERKAALAKLQPFLSAQDAPADAKPTFSPVMERVLPGGEPCRQVFFQFRGGETYIVGNGPGTSADERAFDEKRIDDAGGVDMSAVSNDEKIFISGVGCFFTRDLNELKWEHSTAEDVVDAINRARDVEGSVTPAKAEWPITYLFKTARGEVGIMEVLGTVEVKHTDWSEQCMKFRYKLVQGTGTTTSKITLPKLNFGKESQGLQAALAVTSGEPFGLRIYLRNVSDKAIALDGAIYRQEDECLLTDADGKPVPITRVTHDIKVGMGGGYHGPGQVAVFQSAGLSFQSLDKVPSSAGYVAQAKPGRYTLRMKLRLPGDDVPFAPNKGVWHGELETGPVTIEVKDPATQTVTPVADAIWSSFLGKPVEITVNDLQTTHENGALSLDTGKLLPVPANITLDALSQNKMTKEPAPSVAEAWVRAQEEALTWARNNQVDAVAFVTTKEGKVVKCGLLCPDLLVFRVPNKDWTPDLADPRMLKEHYEKALQEWNFIPRFAEITSDGQFPETYLILDTRTHRRGVLQILGVSDKPRGVKISYRLIEGAAVKKAATTNAPELPKDK